MKQSLSDTANTLATTCLTPFADAFNTSATLGVSDPFKVGDAIDPADGIATTEMIDITNRIDDAATVGPAATVDPSGVSVPVVAVGTAAALAWVEVGMVVAVGAQRVLWRASAELFRAIDDTLLYAVAHPEVFLCGLSRHRRDDVEFAERAAAADLAVRLSLAETTVRNHGMIARTLRERLPLVWARFTEGGVSTQNVREAAVLAVELPESLWAAFEGKVLAAAELAPAQFRVRVRAISEKLQAQTLTERHRAAREQRRVWCEIDRDGMGWLHAHLPAEHLAKVGANLDSIAFHLFAGTDETRTMAQLRADVLSDLLTGATDPDAGRASRTDCSGRASHAGRADCSGQTGCADGGGCSGGDHHAEAGRGDAKWKNEWRSDPQSS